MTHSTDIHVGRKVREIRATKAMSQKELGKLLGVSFQQIQKYEKGANRIGSSRLWDIATSLDTPITYFFEGIEDKKPTDDKILPRRTIELAQKIDSITDENIRRQILNLIKVCSR